MENKVSIQEKKEIIIDFLLKCNSYGEKKLLSYRSSGLNASNCSVKIKSWEKYIEFNEHAIRELKDNTLDNWFESGKRK